MENQWKKKESVWIVHGKKPDAATKEGIAAIAEALSCSSVLAGLLWRRGYRTPKAALSYLHFDETSFHDPFLMKDMDRAVESIFAAIAAHKRMVIYGDYDVDGVTSVTLLYLYLRSLGAMVTYYIPSRTRDGYGMNETALNQLKKEGAEFLITVDTGITAIEETAYAIKSGMEVVITDHHECRDELPLASAVINPHRPDCPYPFKELAGVGVVFKLICALAIKQAEKTGTTPQDAVRQVSMTYTDLVAIGTVADVMPIVDENRLIVAFGLRRIASSERPGLNALIDAALPASALTMMRALPAPARLAARQKKITSTFIGFGLAPRINAAGRMSDATRAVELFLAQTPATAEALAAELCAVNTSRQQEENRMAEQAFAQIESDFDFSRDRMIVLESDNWQQGVIGIVSSRVTERYGLPSIMISFEGNLGEAPQPDDVGKGSGRSIRGLNLVEALTACEDLLARYGGHELAAGLTIRRDKVDEFRKRINLYARSHLTDDMLAPRVEVDCALSPADMTLNLADDILRLEPFGTGNPVPVFAMEDLSIFRIIALSTGKHTKLLLTKEGQTYTALCFGTPTTRFPYVCGDRVDVLFQLSINEYMGSRTLQMVIQDIRINAAYRESCEKEKTRWERIRAGETFDDTQEHVIPTRDDFAVVYRIIRREFRAGRTTFTQRDLQTMLENESPAPISYVKLRFILRILAELDICGVEEIAPDLYRFLISYQGKTSIERSTILKKLRSQNTAAAGRTGNH